jgi:hypothetical protein
MFAEGGAESSMPWFALQVRSFYLGLLVSVATLLFVLGASWITGSS